MESASKGMLDRAATVPIVLKGSILVCMWSAEETAAMVTLLQQNGYNAKVTPSADELVAQAIADNPDLLIVAEDVPPYYSEGHVSSEVVRKVRQAFRWPGEWDSPVIILFITRQPSTRSLMSPPHSRLADHVFSRFVTNDELINIVKRVIFYRLSV